MKTNNDSEHDKVAPKTIHPNKTNLPGYPPYPRSEDIYNALEKEENIEPDDVTREKTAIEKEDQYTEMDAPDAPSGKDIDVPGAELDDEQEDIGNEDEENNFYSLASDEQNDLEEDNDNKTLNT